jgi:hypothetical protein
MNEGQKAQVEKLIIGAGDMLTLEIYDYVINELDFDGEEYEDEIIDLIEERHCF